MFKHNDILHKEAITMKIKNLFRNPNNKDFKKQFWKNGIKTTLIIFITLLFCRIAFASEWAQYTPSPTTNTITSIFSLNNQKAVLIDDETNYYVYNVVHGIL